MTTEVQRIAARFARQHPESTLRLIAPGGPLRFLIDLGLTHADYPPWALDVHLRADGEGAPKVQLYHGGTSLLSATLQSRGVRFEADDAYLACAPAAARILRRTFSLPLAPEQIADVIDYLGAAIEHVRTAPKSTHFDREHEGWWQSRISLGLGRDWTPDHPFLVIDRESVLGFTHEEDRAQFFAGFETSYREQVEAIRTNSTVRLSKEDPEGARECDFLAIDRDGELLCVELKHRSHPGAYWGPVQAYVYGTLFGAVLEDIRADVRALALQKIEVGLLPAPARAFVEAAPLARVRTAIVFADRLEDRPPTVRNVESICGTLGPAAPAIWTAEEIDGVLHVSPGLGPSRPRARKARR